MLIHVWDCSTNGTRVAALQMVLPVVEGNRAVTAGDLIAARVRQEVDRYNETQPERFEGLVQPEEAEQILNEGLKSRASRLDADTQIERARRSFERNGFLVLVNGKQVEDWGEAVAVGAEIEMEFVRLVPLIGG